MADTDIFDVPSAPNNFDLTGKVVMVHDKTQPEATSTVMVEATKLAGTTSQDDLQDVTDRGANTTNALDVNGDTTHVSTNATTGFGFATVGTGGGKGYFAIGKNDGTYAQIYPDNLTGNQTLQLPDTSGTLYVKPYKEYVAILSQSGTDAPVATVLQNELGPVTFSRTGVGQYTLTCTGAFSSGKVFISPLNSIITDGSDTGFAFYAGVIDSNVIAISSYGMGSTGGPYYVTTAEDDHIFTVPITIRVYP